MDPPGDPIPININSIDVNDAIPGDAEILQSARRLRSGLKAKDVKGWLQAAITVENGSRRLRMRMQERNGKPL